MAMIEIVVVLYEFIGIILLTSIIFIASTFVHELGHLLAARKIDKSAYIKIHFFGKALQIKTHWISNNREINRKIYQAGVRWGLFFILFAGVFYWYALFLLIPYAIGAQSDLKKIEDLKR